jgi:predicted component of type VI protein secretion system
MKVKLVVASGVHEGREIPIAGPQFVIGRDPQCQLRPSSPAISKRHCAIFVKGGKVFLRDFGSTNGTFANGQQVQGEVEVTGTTPIKVGPLDFRLVVEPAAPPVPAAAVAGTAPAAPPKKSAAKAEDDEFAAFLLDGDSGPATAGSVPEGSTIMEMSAVKPGDPDPDAKAKDKPKADSKAAEADTRSAAAEILSKYRRRPRS